MCNLYSMTATVDELRRIFGPFDGDTQNLPPFDEIYPGHQAPVLLRKAGRRPRARDDEVGFSGAGVGGIAAGDQRPQPVEPVLAQRAQ